MPRIADYPRSEPCPWPTRRAVWSKRVKKNWKAILTLAISILSVGGVAYGVFDWGTNQSIDSLNIFCSNAAVTQFQSSYGAAGGRVILSIGFANPSFFPIHIEWAFGAELNGTNYGLGGFLLNQTVPRGHSILRMSIFVPELPGNYTLNRIYDHESFSVLSNVFSEPRIFSRELDESAHVRGSRLVNDTAIQVPAMLVYLFSTHSNTNASAEEPCTWFAL